MKYPKEVQEYLEKVLHPVLKEKTPAKLVKECPKLIQELKTMINNIEEDKKLLFWLGNQRKLYCTDKVLKEIKSDNYIKQTKTNETIVKTKVKKTKPLIQIDEKGGLSTIQIITEEKQTEEKQYSKLEYIFQSDYAREREEITRALVKKAKDKLEKLEKTHGQTLDKINKTIDNIEEDAKIITPALESAIKLEVNELILYINKITTKKQNNEIIDVKEYEMLSKLKKSLLDNYTAFSRAKTGGIYQIANLLYPTREKMFNEIKSVEDSLLKCDMAYIRLAESDGMLVEKRIKSLATDKDEEIIENELKTLVLQDS